MSDAGYTLIETLTALAILALAISGLTAGIQVLALQQARVAAPAAAAQEVRGAQMAVDRLLAEAAPLRSDEPSRFRGDAAGFAAACGRPEPCRLDLRIVGGRLEAALDDLAGQRAFRLGPASEPLVVRYVGGHGVYDRWPPAGPERQTLRAVILSAADPARRPKVVSRAWREQAFGCQFDTVLRDCR